MLLYADHGVRFRYPEDWELTEDHGAQEVCITVAGPGTSFWSLALFPDRPGPHEVIESAVAAFRDEYDELDDYPAETDLAGLNNVSRDLEFVCLDMLNGAYLRSFRTDRFTVFVMYQGTDRDLEQTREVMESISESLMCDPGWELP